MLQTFCGFLLICCAILHLGWLDNFIKRTEIEDIDNGNPYFLMSEISSDIQNIMLQVAHYCGCDSTSWFRKAIEIPYTFFTAL